MNKILNMVGAGLLLLATYQRFIQPAAPEPAYSTGLIGAILIAISVWMRDK